MKKKNAVLVKTPNFLFLVQIWLVYTNINPTNEVFKNLGLLLFIIYGQMMIQKPKKTHWEILEKQTDGLTDKRDQF